MDESDRMNKYLKDQGNTAVIVPTEVYEIAVESIGAFFEPICKADRQLIAADFLDLSKCSKRVGKIERYAPLFGKKMLEIGSGFGTNLVISIAEFGVRWMTA